MFLMERFASTMGIGVNPAASEALRQARAFADSGDFDKALEKHEWYHEHAVELDPSQRGVRLSFALNSWIQLGAKYPPALASLKTICDDNIINFYSLTLLVKNGNWEKAKGECKICQIEIVI